MKKLIALLTGALLVVNAAKANFYSDNNPADVWINALNPSYTGTFTLDGYDPMTETVLAAQAEFTLWDGLGKESVKIDMSGDLFTYGSFSSWLYLGGSVVNAYAVLDATGVLSYTVSRNDNGILSEFWLKNAYLGVETGPRPVPDTGATAALLGLGLLGVFATARARAKR